MEIRKLEAYKDKLKQIKDVYKDLQQEAFQFAYPAQARYFERDRSEAPQINHDSYATRAVKICTDGFIAMNFNPSVKNFSLTVAPELMKKRNIQKALKEIEEDLVYIFSTTRVYQQAAYAVRDAFIAGGGFMSITGDDAGMPTFTRRHIADMIVGTDNIGNIDTQFRKFIVTREELVHKFPDLPPEVTERNSSEPLEEIEVWHAILPKRAEAYFDETFTQRYRSIYYTTAFGEEGGTILEEGFFRSFPYATFRIDGDAFDPYGSGLIMQVIPEIKLLNQISKTEIKLSHRASDPPVNVPVEMEGKENLNPGGRNYYADAERYIMPIETGGRFDIAEHAFDRRRELLDDYLYVNFFQMLKQIDREMTAFEVSQRLAEKGSQLVLIANGFQEEFLAKLIERTIEIRLDAGVYDLPSELLGEAIMIDHMSPMANMQKRMYAESSIRNFIEFTGLTAQFDPNAAKMVRWNQVLKDLHMGYNLSPDYLMTDQEYEGMMQQQAEQQQAMLAAEVANKTGGANAGRR